MYTLASNKQKNQKPKIKISHVGEQIYMQMVCIFVNVFVCVCMHVCIQMCQIHVCVVDNCKNV